MRAGYGLDSRKTLVLCIALAQCTQPCSSASAQPSHADGAAVQLSIADCDGIPGTEIASLIALELRPRQRIVAESESAGALHASLRCVAEHATITVDDARRPRPLTLDLELGDTKPEARPRFVALAVAELIATSGLEPDEVRKPRPQPEPVVATHESRSEARGHRTSLSLAVGAVRAFEPALFAPAFSLGIAHRFAPFSLGLEVEYERGQMSTPDARVTAHNLALALLPAWHAEIERLDLALGIGLRAGHTWLTATPRKPNLVGRDLSGYFVAPIASARLSLPATRWLAPGITLEAGYLVKPVRGFDADRAPLIALRGLWLCALLGVAW
jgi:hypothetical protein